MSPSWLEIYFNKRYELFKPIKVRFGSLIVPLSNLAIAILKHIHAINGEHELVFIGDHNPYNPMSENTINTALRIMGYDTKNEVCRHGFRAMACSALVESGLWSKDAIERQMSHQVHNDVRDNLYP